LCATTLPTKCALALEEADAQKAAYLGKGGVLID
jgi:hypothetical protein